MASQIEKYSKLSTAILSCLNCGPDDARLELVYFEHPYLFFFCQECGEFMELHYCKEGGENVDKTKV